jgi:glutamate racemase
VYEKEINKIKNGINIVSKPCPMFVPLVEEGWWENQVAIMVAKEYLCELKSIGIDTLVLGCTHYPLLINTIQKVMGPDVKLISSATEVSNFTKQALLENNIFTNQNAKATHKFYTSDSVEKFITLGSHILDMEIKYAEKIDIEQY